MTIEQFNNTRFGSLEPCLYKGEPTYIISIDHEEALIGIQEFINGGEGDWTIGWKRCENVELAPISTKP